MKKKIKIGYIGVGRRGSFMLKACFGVMNDVEVVTVCDIYEPALNKVKDIYNELKKPIPLLTKNADDIFNNTDIDAVVIMTGWHDHIPLAKKAMKAGKYTAIEVGGAFDLSECFDLVNIHEETGAQLMMLENCCYGRLEMMALNLVKRGLFGEIVHCSGGYLHELPEVELFKDLDCEHPHYRMNSYVHRNCEQYPTHELGPISKVLSINRGNRYISLSSFASKAVGLSVAAAKHLGKDSKWANMKYCQGDIITTILTCANGETVLLTLDTTLPRPYYSRGFTIRGTKGMCSEERHSVFLEGMKEPVENNEKEMYKNYDHPLWKEYSGLNITRGHGGIDWLVCRAFVEAVKKGIEPPIDVYDTVTLMAVTALSEMSISQGGTPIAFPDFTRGKWILDRPKNVSKYSLDELITDDTSPICP